MRGRAGDRERPPTRSAGLLASVSTTCSRSSGPYSWPIRRAIARALPPVASAICGCGGSSLASPLRTALRAASISAVAGGSPCRSDAVRRSEPRSTERTHAGPSSSVPTTTSVEPPPTSQTATTPSPGFARETAPVNASRPSSSAETTRTSAPVARPIASRSRSGESPWRPGAVTTVSSSRTPCLRAMRAYSAVTSRTSSSLLRRTRPWRRISLPSPRCCRSSRMLRTSSPATDATSRRTVFEPTSMTPTFMPVILTSTPVRPPSFLTGCGHLLPCVCASGPVAAG